MGIEVPTIAAFVSRMQGSETQLAAFGGVIFPLALLIEAPIIMMLAASTSLSRDLVSFRALRPSSSGSPAIFCGRRRRRSVPPGWASRS